MPSDHSQKHDHSETRAEPDFSLEVIVLLILCLFWLIFGLLLLRIYTGDLPYNPDSAYGLFLVIVSFQMITMGKTPFGDLRRSWALVLIGMGTAVLGISACFIPGYFSGFVRTLVGLVLFAGGLALFLHLFVSEKRARLWIRIPGILRQLTIACASVYALTIISGMITLVHGFRTDPRTAIFVMLYGMSFFYLTWCIWKVSKTYPPQISSEQPSIEPVRNKTGTRSHSSLFSESSLSLSLAILILLGVLITLLGLLLFPVNLGILPFSPDGQLGLIMTILAIQIMTMGDTPLGQYRRSWLMIMIGFSFAGLGVFSCIVPGILTGMIRVLLGILNIMGGAVFFARRFFTKPDGLDGAPYTQEIDPLIKRLAKTQVALNSVSIVFGLSMLLPGLVSGLIVASILVINGGLIFTLASLVQQVSQIQSSLEQQVI